MLDNDASLLPLFGIVAVVLLLAVFAIFFFSLLRLWLMGFMARAPITLPQILAMRLRRLPAAKLCEAYIQAVQANLGLTLDQIERAHLQGADVTRCVHAACRAQQTGQPVSWEDLVQTDLSG